MLSHTDRAEFEERFLKERPALKRFAQYLAGHTADDLLNDTVVILFTHWKKFKPETDFAAWAKLIMRRVWIGEYRREKIRSAIFVSMDRTRDPDGDDDVEPFEGIATGDPERAIIAAQCHDAVTRLKPVVADILTDAALGCALEDIAARSALPINTVRSHIRRGRAQLMAATGGV